MFLIVVALFGFIVSPNFKIFYNTSILIILLYYIDCIGTSLITGGVDLSIGTGRSLFIDYGYLVVYQDGRCG